MSKSVLFCSSSTVKCGVSGPLVFKRPLLEERGGDKEYPWKERDIEGRRVSSCGPGLKQVSRLNSQDSQNSSGRVASEKASGTTTMEPRPNTNISVSGSASPAAIKQPHRITIKETVPVHSGTGIDTAAYVMRLRRPTFIPS